MSWFDAVFLALLAGEVHEDGARPAPVLFTLLLGVYPGPLSLLGAALLWALGRSLLTDLRSGEGSLAQRLITCAALYHALLPLRFL